MRSFIFIPAIALVAATPVIAAPASSWTVDKAHSQVGFVASMNGQAINGSFRRFDARIAFDPANLAGSSVTAVIDTASAATGDQTRDEALPSADWFSAKVFPRATFTAKTFKSLGGNRYQALGTLTIRGVNHQVAMPFELAITGSAAQMRGTVTIDRRWFGVGQGQFATPDAVAANVKVNIAIAARKAG
jgi:polyisoprenoid-binding protein YceI